MSLSDNLYAEMVELREKRRRLPEHGRPRASSKAPSKKETAAVDRLTAFFSKQSEKGEPNGTD